MSTLDDLLSQRRRAPLSEADERRVQIGIKSSRDHQLALLAGEAFDRDGAPQPGDAELVRKIVRQVEGEWSGTFQRQAPGKPRWSRWAAVPTLIASVAAASWGGERLLHAVRNDVSQQPASSPVVSGREVSEAVASEGASEGAPEGVVSNGIASNGIASKGTASKGITAERPAVRVLEAPAVVGAPAARARVAPPDEPRSALDATEDVAPSASRPRASRSPASSTTSVARPRAAAPVLLRAAAPRVEGPAPELGAEDTARSLFLRANRLRRDDWSAAAGLYEQLTRRFADSVEAGVAEMALGKHALDEGHPGQALSWFRAYQQRPGGELRSEALWGEARALESLGEAAAARAVWRRLISEFPGSAYAAVARQQLGL